jgi:hypothetical protein
MVLASQLTIGSLNVFLGGILHNTQGSIVVFELHYTFSSDASAYVVVGLTSHLYHEYCSLGRVL